MAYQRHRYGPHRARLARWQHYAALTRSLVRCVEITASLDSAANVPIDYSQIDAVLEELSQQIEAVVDEMHVSVIREAVRVQHHSALMHAAKADRLTA